MRDCMLGTIFFLQVTTYGRGRLASLKLGRSEEEEEEEEMGVGMNERGRIYPIPSLSVSLFPCCSFMHCKSSPPSPHCIEG